MDSVFYTAVLIMLRVSGVIAAVPGGRRAPWTLRIGLAIALALILVPGQMTNAAAVPQTWLTILLAALGEFLLGFSLGLGVAIVFSALTLAGKLISYVSGLGANEIFDPLTGEANSPIGKFLFLLGAAAFLAVNGHHRVIEALMHTYATFPPGEVTLQSLSESYVLLTTLTAESFSFGLQISMGVITALLLVLIGFAVISRVAPMINLMSVGWSVNMLLTLGVVLVSLGTIITVFSQFAADKLGAF